MNYGGEQDLLLLFHEPSNIRGWLRVGSAGLSDEQLLLEIREWMSRLEVLSLYVFCKDELGGINECLITGEATGSDRIRPLGSQAHLCSRLVCAIASID